ncbi:MAG: threonine synthase [Peptococcaceae bacterium]|jgi:threonine synthase|nr:threonine synthase [Peptococcaceae bacterium]
MVVKEIPVLPRDTVSGLKCRECGREYPVAPVHVCEFCFGPLEVNYDYDAVARKTSREKIGAGPLSIWRYRDFLPVAGRGVDFQVGFTPLIRADNLARAIGLKELYIKNDAVNPTFSFKDRVVAVALAKAVEFGFDTVACVSTGNLACATAAQAARAGLRCYVLVPADLEKGKINNMAVYGPNVVLVAGNYDDVNRLGSEIADRYDWAFVNINIRPFYAEGSKTLGFETVEQLGWRAPGHVVVPVASGSLLTRIHRGIVEMQRVGLISETPVRVSGAQAAGCAPVANAFAGGTMDVRPVKPRTIAKSLAIGNPADGYYALKTVRETGGFVEQVDDAEIVAGIRLLAATEGVFTEPAGGVTVAVLKKLAAAGKIRPEETTVAYITGNGLKAQEAVEEAIRPTCVVEPNLASLAGIIEREVC